MTDTWIPFDVSRNNVDSGDVMMMKKENGTKVKVPKKKRSTMFMLKALHAFLMLSFWKLIQYLFRGRNDEMRGVGRKGVGGWNCCCHYGWVHGRWKVLLLCYLRITERLPSDFPSVFIALSISNIWWKPLTAILWLPQITIISVCPIIIGQRKVHVNRSNQQFSDISRRPFFTQIYVVCETRKGRRRKIGGKGINEN